MSYLRIPKNIYLVLLAAAVLASSLAWAPLTQRIATSADQAVTRLSAAAAPSLTALVQRNYLTIRGTGLQPGRRYQVISRTGNTDGWYSLGFVRANGKGKVRTSLRLPWALIEATNIRTCLVDTFNWSAVCTHTVRRFP